MTSCMSDVNLQNSNLIILVTIKTKESGHVQEADITSARRIIESDKLGNAIEYFLPREAAMLARSRGS